MPQRRAMKIVARLGIFVFLFQAILFGWHHHDLVFAGSHPQPATVHSGAGPTQPADDEDGCDICQVLHHQAASSGNGSVTPLPGLSASPSVTPDPVFVACDTALAFRARAPPLV
jgi:hypothetical protein